MKCTIKLFILTLSFIFVGCATTENEVAFSKVELEEFLVGKTFPLSKGAMYFDTRDKLTAIWEGQVEKSAWWATDDSQFCYELNIFGGKECLGLFKTGNNGLVRVYEGNRKYLKITDIKVGKTF